MEHIDNFSFSGKKALIRVDFNVPLNENFEITDETRINAALPTIRKVLNSGGSVLLMSHLGRPKGQVQDKFSLQHLISCLSNKLNVEVKFASDCIGSLAEKASDELKPGEVLLLENLRFYSEETNGDVDFARSLSNLGDVYINDAFGTAHRAHASTAIIASFFEEAKMFGYVIENELEAINQVVEKNERPFTAIMGGAKISDKILIIEKLLDQVDNLIIGGGMSYTFFKAMGGEIGSSLVEEDKLSLAETIIQLAKEKNVNLCLPQDSVLGDAFNAAANTQISSNTEIPNSWMGLDIGPLAIQEFSDIIARSKTIMWNGPMGVFEWESFSNGTKMVAEAIAEATRNGAYSLIGGGDSAAAINAFNMQEHVSYISTGGGALLEYLEGKELPGIKAIME